MRFPWRRTASDRANNTGTDAPTPVRSPVTDEDVQAERDDLWDRYIQAQVDMQAHWESGEDGDGPNPADI